MPEIPMPPTMVNSIKDNLRITDTHLNKLHKYQEETLKFTTSENAKYDNITNTLSSENDMEKHLVKHELWMEQVIENIEDTEKHIKY